MSMPNSLNISVNSTLSALNHHALHRSRLPVGAALVRRHAIHSFVSTMIFGGRAGRLPIRRSHRGAISDLSRCRNERARAPQEPARKAFISHSASRDAICQHAGPSPLERFPVHFEILFRLIGRALPVADGVKRPGVPAIYALTSAASKTWMRGQARA